MNSDEGDNTKIVDMSASRLSKAALSHGGEVSSGYATNVCRAQARVFGERLKDVQADLRRALEREREAVLAAQRAQAESEEASEAVNALKRAAAELLLLKEASEQRAASLRQHLNDIAQTRQVHFLANSDTRTKVFGLLCLGWGFSLSAQPRLETAGMAVILIALIWLARHLSENIGW